MRHTIALTLASALAIPTPILHAAEKQLLWGDTHLHTMYSSDAYANNNTSAGPDTAFRWARGMPVIHPYHKARVQIGTPLDFLVISDHAEFLGQIRNIHVNGVDTEGLGPIDKIKAWGAAWYLNRAIDNGNGRELFMQVLPDPDLTPEQDAEQSSLENSSLNVLPMPRQVEIDTWRTITDTAEQYNEPGVFTTLLGWEWSSIPGGANLHRVVITDSDAATAQQYDPFGLDDSPYPEDLWRWLDRTSESTGARFTAIPHNSNISKGFMFSDTSLRGEPFNTEYMSLRNRWEKIAEITQIKGDSETYPSLSPDDEFADFERYTYYIQRKSTPYTPQRGDFVREALKRGLELEQRLGQNPYRLGVIGSTDSHTALASAEEDNFQGKLATDSTPENKQSAWNGKSGPSGWSMSASGLAAVWSEGNTRKDIMDALQRREVYATTGPRIGVKFQGATGVAMPEGAAVEPHNTIGKEGVPMGGELSGPDTPTFSVLAAMDPKGAHLDRVQIIKGWVDENGSSQEKIYNVAWSDDRELDASGHLPPVGNTVNLSTGKVENSIGSPMLSAVWTDPDFDSEQNAFYYARVLQIPTVRHSMLDAIALGLDKAGDKPDTIQERAYTSPIWYRSATP
jgi:hypothetical protein